LLAEERRPKSRLSGSCNALHSKMVEVTKGKERKNGGSQFKEKRASGQSASIVWGNLRGRKVRVGTGGRWQGYAEGRGEHGTTS